jgi:hypothetical protein
LGKRASGSLESVRDQIGAPFALGVEARKINSFVILHLPGFGMEHVGQQGDAFAGANELLPDGPEQLGGREDGAQFTGPARRPGAAVEPVKVAIAESP